MSEPTGEGTNLSPQGLPEGNRERKPIKPPTITPRRFTRFFTPVAASKSRRNVRTSRRALQAITNPPERRKDPIRPPNLLDKDSDLKSEPQLPNEPRGRKRKVSFVAVEFPRLASPLSRDPFFPSSSQENHEGSVRSRTSSPAQRAYQQEESEPESIVEDESGHGDEAACSDIIHRARRFDSLSKSSSILCTRLSGRNRRKEVRESHTWQFETASFFSKASDTYYCENPVSGHPALPFCSASCNSKCCRFLYHGRRDTDWAIANSLVAVGDEEGSIRLLDSASHVTDGFSKAYLTFKVHENAIMDLEFSEDDRLLATGSGDQTCRVVDMLTQQTIHTLAGHSSSIKQVRFQPGSKNNLVASCSRDGNINIWDLRIRGVDRPAQHLRCWPSVSGPDAAPGFDLPAAYLRDSIRAAHSGRLGGQKAAIPKPRFKPRRVEASITSLVFLGAGREHLLATTSEADATVKLWDLRTTYDTRRARPLPLSTTRQPDTHEAHRRVGLTSMALSSDSARLYTLCRDHTIYAYSTSHLILGHAPELTSTSTRPRRAGGAEREGLGPLYGFRHRQLKVSTFYVKLSVRKPKGDQVELLATGSGNECPVLFPTNERYLGGRPLRQSSPHEARPNLRRLHSGWDRASFMDNGIPIHSNGTALIRGHRKEVTAVSWTSGGELVTTSDDFHVRCWREGDAARSLRIGGEGEGRRWMCGWADMDTAYDSDE